ncbi:MAG: hypothetical protein WD737_12470 [Gemmatimonadota bacterium]
MKLRLRHLVGTLVAVAGVFIMAALTRVPWDVGETHAFVRLSWRTPGEFVEECRRPSAEELAALPVHMRREEICEGRMISYRLRVAIDGRAVIDESVRAAGAREDRPLYVYRDLPVSPGDHEILVRWDPERPAGARRVDGRSTPGGRGAVDGLAITATVRLEPREIALVTYDRNLRRFILRGAGT